MVIKHFLNLGHFERQERKRVRAAGGRVTRRLEVRRLNELGMSLRIAQSNQRHIWHRLVDHDQRAEFLFYDPNQLLQLSVKVNLVHTKASKEKFESLPEPSKKDYSSVQFPGTFVKAPDRIQYDFEKGHFVELHFVASQFEYLKLKRPNHLRARFYAERAWEGEFLAP